MRSVRHTLSMPIAVEAILTVGASIGAVQVAHADDSCNNERVCIYNNGDYSGELEDKAPGLGLMELWGSKDDKLSSYRNTSGTDAKFYRDHGGAGGCFSMWSETQRAYTWGTPEHDSASSWRTNGSC